MHEEEYSYINNIFKNELDNEIVNSYLLFANKLMPFLDFIIKCRPLTPSTYQSKNYRSYHIAFNYIKENHPKYFPELIRMFSMNEIHIGNYSCDNASCDSYTGEIWLGKNQTILDDLNLVHEFFHHMNLIPINSDKNQKKSITRDLFGESISIAAQLDFSKKIIENDLKQDAVNFEINYINDCILCSKRIRVELILIEIYKKHGKINDELIKKYISNCQDTNLQNLIIDEYQNVLNAIGGWGSNFKIPFNLRYVLGITIGYYLSDLIEKNNQNWKVIYDINDDFYNMNIDDFLNKIGINLQDDTILLNFMEHYKKLNTDHVKKK